MKNKRKMHLEENVKTEYKECCEDINIPFPSQHFFLVEIRKIVKQVKIFTFLKKVTTGVPIS